MKPNDGLTVLAFHMTLHARGSDVTLGESIELHGQNVCTLSVPHAALAIPLPVSFETAYGALERLPRMFIEPDGSFVWTSAAADQQRWQVDGNLFDRAGKLQFVDLKGTCPTPEFDLLLAAFDGPRTPMMFQLVREAVFLDEQEFRRFAAFVAQVQQAAQQ